MLKNIEGIRRVSNTYEAQNSRMAWKLLGMQHRISTH